MLPVHVASLRGCCAAPGPTRQLYLSCVRFRSHYETLGISSTAKAGDIKSQFYKLSKEWHPDKHGGCKNATQKFQEISEAYSTLSDESKRRDYDRRNGFSSRGPQSRSHTTNAKTSEEFWRAHYQRHTRYGQYGGGYRQPNARQPRMDQRKVPFNFEEWYRMHYGPDAMRRARSFRNSRQAKQQLQQEVRARAVGVLVMVSIVVVFTALIRVQETQERWG